MKALGIFFVILWTQASSANLITADFECAKAKTSFTTLLKYYCGHNYFKRETPVLFGGEFLENGEMRIETTIEGTRKVCPRKAYFTCLPAGLSGCDLDKAWMKKLEEMAKSPVDRTEAQLIALDQEQLKKSPNCAIEASNRNLVRKVSEEMQRNHLGLTPSLFGVPKNEAAK